jgi:hypothetical protein
MSATLQDVTARRSGSTVRLAGTIETPEGGWTLAVEADNPGVAGNLDEEVRVTITATPPEVGAQVITLESFDETFGANPQDVRVVVRLIGLTTKDGEGTVVVEIEDDGATGAVEPHDDEPATLNGRSG